MKKTAANSEQASRKLAALPAENARELNSRMGSMGWSVFSSATTKAAVSRTPPARAMTVSALPQPMRLPRISPQTIPKVATVMSVRPRASSLVRGP